MRNPNENCLLKKESKQNMIIINGNVLYNTTVEQNIIKLFN